MSIAQTPECPVSAADSYRICRRMARQAASSFYWTFWLLPRAKRHAMCALYAFSRHTDDLVDSPLPIKVRRELIGHWRTALQAGLAGENVDPLLPALRDAVRRYQIPTTYLFDVIDGVEMDLTTSRYQTFDELTVYCRRVASAVGLACLHIWGYSNPKVLAPAMQCGLAFQMTNILRDLHEDAGRNRIYLPQEELSRFDYGEQELMAGVADERFERLLAFQLERTERLYHEGAQVQQYLQGEGRRMFRLMFATYHELLQEIRRCGGNILHQRVRLGAARKLSLALRQLRIV